MTETTPVLEIEKLSISFMTRLRQIDAVMDFSVTVNPGEAVGLVGESGCGKSTVALGVMRDLGGNGKITGGSIKFKGRDMASMDDDELRQVRGRDIAMIYQEPMASLNPAMTVGAQLMEVPQYHDNVSTTEARARALELVRDVKLPDPERVLNAYPHQLSGGQQQRIVIAMALMAKPALLILDEPTTALDVTVEAAVIKLVKELGQKYGTSMLFISHNLGLVMETCDRICVMYSGEAVERGPVKDVFENMHHPYTQALFRAIPVPGADKNRQPLVAIPGNFPLPHQRPTGCNFGPRCTYFKAGTCDSDPIQMATLPGNPQHQTRCNRFADIDWAAQLDTVAAPPARVSDTVTLSVKGLRKYYDVAANALFGGRATNLVKANETLSFDAHEGETLAIVGESGCGKSTFSKVLMGLETATEGTIELNGRSLASVPIQDRDTQTVGAVQMVFQNPFDTLNPSMTVGRQIMRALEVFGIGDSDTARKDRMFELLDLVKLPRAFADRSPRQLSGGQKQRVGIARAFAGNARLVVADEPVSALDVSVQAAVTELLMDIQRKNGTTLLFISHDLSIVQYLADRVLVMYLGHVVELGTTEQVFSPPYHPYTEALLAAAPIADTRVKKREVILEGDIPSALTPPSGCPFQTRCNWKSKVKGGLCEREVPPTQTLVDGHQIKCHLDAQTLSNMAPVFSFAAE
ncbi:MULTISPECIES: dipeptide ABC transporter ATP-binding protein [unclassified Phaeobacter]|uniref:dipeptide ABC transporter ATP-binding protein n=1 Tax=unclassified Phaeobacter TaxID=2621772 RepID=UPI003A8C7DC9